MSKVGRKNKYDPDVTPKLVEDYAKEGYGDLQIAEILGINKSTFYAWLQKHEELKDALKKGREPANLELKLAMMKAAQGYYVEEEETVAILDVETRQPKSFRKTTRKKYIAPSPTMQIFLAKNRMPDEFKDVNKQEVDLKGEMTLADLMKENYANRKKETE